MAAAAAALVPRVWRCNKVTLMHCMLYLGFNVYYTFTFGGLWFVLLLDGILEADYDLTFDNFTTAPPLTLKTMMKQQNF